MYSNDCRLDNYQSIVRVRVGEAKASRTGPGQVEHVPHWSQLISLHLLSCYFCPLTPSLHTTLPPATAMVYHKSHYRWNDLLSRVSTSRVERDPLRYSNIIRYPHREVHG